VFEPRDLELCSRLNLWHAVHCDEQIDWLAAHKTQVPHRVFLKMNSGHEPPGLHARALPRRLGAPERPAAGDLAHDALQRRRRAARHRPPDGRLRPATRDLPGERSLCNSAATCAMRRTPGARRLGARRHRAVRQRARPPSAAARTGICSPA
jgi:alanine racemase